MNSPGQSGPNPGELRLFSIEQANSMVPLLTESLIEIHSLRQVVVSVMESKADVAKSNGHLKLDRDEARRDLNSVSTAAERITDLIDRINQTGAELKDLELGLVDFPHRREGRIVYLCWMFGEDRVAFWHELDTGAAGRRPL